MNVNSILNGTYSEPTASGKRSQLTGSLVDQLQKTLAGGTTSGSSSSDTLREILGEYDVTDITPRQFSEMLQKLQDSGAISREVTQELAMVRLDLEQDGLDPDESVNLVDYYTEKLASRREADQTDSILTEDKPSATVLARRLEWMEKFALVQSGSGAGVDATA